MSLIQHSNHQEALSAVGGISPLVSEFHRQYKAPPSGDRVLSALAYAAFREAHQNPAFERVLEDVIVLRRMQNDELGESEVAGIIRCALFNDQLQLGKEPHTWDDWQQWVGPIRELTELVSYNEPPAEFAERAERLQMNLTSDLVSTNPYTRASIEELLMQALHTRFGHYRVLDIGASMLETSNQILGKEQYPFDPIKLYRALGKMAVKDWHPDHELTAKANELLSRPHLVEHFVAIDLVDPYKSVANQKLARASLRAIELNDPHFIAKYDGLAALRPAELDFFQADAISSKDMDRLDKCFGNEKYNIIIESTVQHEISRKDAAMMDALAKERLTPDGIIIKKDFMFTYRNRPNRTRSFKHWHKPGRYRAFVYDNARPGAGWQEVMRAKTSRCTELLVSGGKVAGCGREEQTLDELIAKA